MRWLCLWAHPDDEVVGAGGTVRLLVNLGHEVTIVTATDGGAGEITPAALGLVKQLGSLGAVRRGELRRAGDLLGVKEIKVLDFADGTITNQIVWGALTQIFVELIDQYKPEMVMTFDHSGWYFHLDHVGVSIAATVAVQQAEHKSKGLLLNLHKPATAGTRWKYVFPSRLPSTHVVDIATVKEVKLKALQAHVSQNNPAFLDHLLCDPRPREWFQLAFSTGNGLQLLEKSGIFLRT